MWSGYSLQHYDQKSVLRKFQSGDEVLVLLPVATGLQAKFSGPYVVDRKLTDTDYVIKTSDRRRKARVCHVNMLKYYSSRAGGPAPVAPIAVVAAPSPGSEEDELSERRGSVPCACLKKFRGSIKAGCVFVTFA